MHLVLPIASFISALLSLAPLPWHWRAGTIPTISLSLWLFVVNMINGVNTVIWAGNFSVKAVVWCDINTKIGVGANIALPMSIFCLCVHLERVSSLRQVSADIDVKRRRQYLDSFLCFGVPMVYMALHYVVQGHRFDIIEDFGCRAATYVSVASTFLLWVPPLFLSFGAFVLSGLAFRNFWNNRIMFARHLQSNAALTPSRYFRLMAMSLLQMFWGTGVIAFNMWFTMRYGLRPWISWEDVHFNFSRIAVFPTYIIPPRDLLYTYLLWWTVPISSVIFFAFFSFGQDAMKEYRACYAWVRRYIFRATNTTEKESTLPKYDSSTRVYLPALSKPQSIVPCSNSEVKVSSPYRAPYKGYQWNPPPTPSTTSSTYCASSLNDSFGHYAKSKDVESDLFSLSETSHCSTSHNAHV